VFIIGHLGGNSSRKILSFGTNAGEIQGVSGEEEQEVKRLGGLFDKDGKRHQAGSIYARDGLSPILDTAQGGIEFLLL